MEENKKEINKIKILTFFVVLVIVLILSGFIFGYRIVNGFKIAKVGQLTLEIPLPDTLIFIDESKKILTTKENEIVKVSLSPKKHSVIVSTDNHYPWKKDFVVESNGVVKLSPIFVSQNPSGSIVTKNDPEYYKIVSAINKNTPPTNRNPKKSKDESAELWLEDNTVMVKIGDKIFDVVKPLEDIKNLEFYKDGNEAVVFSAGNGVYVIEIDKNGPQNFMPIYKGQNPIFTKDNPNYVYIIDSGILMQVVI
ncbi:MAG: hypothetical protein AB198_01720 [Parcubacteria bacterium C7867-003]|nr:MAG: hypothetical protein AB198_01720 [Parcubacteria bacterium C7867-003]